MNNATQATQNIIANLSSVCATRQYGEIMSTNVLDEMQRLCNEGYVIDVALAKACEMYPPTKNCGRYAYA